MPFSLRLDPETEGRIRRLAASTGRSKSAVVRDAMARYVSAEVHEAGFRRTMLDRLRPFVGVVSSDRHYSVDTHHKYRLALSKKHRGRGSR